jgi:hypothetical protein
VAGKSLQEIAHELSTNALRSQETMLEELRRRAAALFTATAVAVAFLGGRAIDRPHHVLAIFGFIAGGFALTASVLVLLPKKNLAFSLAGPAVYEHLVRQEADVDEAHRILAYWLEGFWKDNLAEIVSLIRTFRLACFLLLLALALWALQFLVPF